MRTMFVLMRLAGYGAVFAMHLFGHGFAWWQWAASLFPIVWGSGDHWKRPDERDGRMRLGVWAEALLVVAWSAALFDSGVLFMLLSPLTRSCIHLKRRDVAAFLAVSAGVLAVMHHVMPSLQTWMLWAQLGSFAALGMYSMVLGQLLREREQTSRLLTVAALEREQRLKEEERMRIASELHDVMGQHWTAVVRALDVALALEGEPGQAFVGKARDAALDGLRDMRNAVRLWNDGRQTPEQWMQSVDEALQRFRSTARLDVEMQRSDIPWSSLADPVGAAEAVARTIFESVVNAVRHGGAARVRIRLHADAEQVRLAVRDDGKGLAGVRSEEAGIGLRSMRRLAEGVGGVFGLESKPGHGTVVSLAMPLQKGESAG